jgi:DNA mismatch repair protein MSH4
MVGLAFVNLDTGEAVLCQICDSQTYVKTMHKLHVYGPSEILIVATAASPKSKLFSIIEENLEIMESKMTLLDRRYWAESAGFEYISTLAFAEDVEAIKLSVSGSYYAVCCIAAVRALLQHGAYVANASIRSSSIPSWGSESSSPSTHSG